MIERFVKRSEFKDYEDFLNNFEVSVPKNFNFGFDVVDFWAKKEPNRIALKVFDTSKNSIDFTFRKIKDLSDNTAGLLQELGIKKGDYVMLMLKNQYQWWVSMIALHKLGAIAIPAPYSLTNEDIEYRCKEIPIKAVIALGNESIIKAIEKAKQKCKNLKHLISVGPNIVTPDVKANMKKALKDIQDGTFAKQWILENQAGRPRYNALQRQGKEHQVEKVGAELRKMMPFIKPTIKVK